MGCSSKRASRGSSLVAHLRLCVLAGALAATFVILTASGGSALTCPPLEYRVAYVSPRCVVTVANALYLPLYQFWWLNPWANNTWQAATDHLNRNASSSERITFIDTNKDVRLSPLDTIQVYEPDCTGELPAGLGTNTTPGANPVFAYQETISLSSGYSYTCYPEGPNPTFLILIATVTTVVIAVPTALIAISRHRHRR